MASERLQKLIAHAGITSRRKAEKLIVAGRVAVDGEVVTDLGSKADPDRQRITVDGEPLPEPPRVYMALHKPPGVVTSVRDPHADRVVLDLLDDDDVEERVYPAGRLDLDSEGLVLLTNDGELMNAMLQPGGEVDKEYEVEVEGVVDEAALQRMRDGMELDGRRLLPCVVEPLGSRPADRPGPHDRVGRYRMVLHEGKNNQIRRMFRAAGHTVVRLVRRGIGPLQLGDLPPGEYRRLDEAAVRRLRRQAGLPADPEGGRS